MCPLSVASRFRAKRRARSARHALPRSIYLSTFAFHPKQEKKMHIQMEKVQLKERRKGRALKIKHNMLVKSICVVNPAVRGAIRRHAPHKVD